MQNTHAEVCVFIEGDENYPRSVVMSLVLIRIPILVFYQMRTRIQEAESKVLHCIKLAKSGVLPLLRYPACPSSETQTEA